MSWRHKAAIQRALARLPAPIGDGVYYALQRTVGGLRRVDPEDRFRPALAIAERLQAQRCSLANATVLEVGTGGGSTFRWPSGSLGARRVITVDLHRYLRLALVRKDLAALRAAPERFRTLFGQYAASDSFRRRFDQLLAFGGTGAELLRLTGIEYLAPADAARLPRGPERRCARLVHGARAHPP